MKSNKSLAVEDTKTSRQPSSMAEIEVSDSWNNRLKTLAENIAGSIPTVGKLLKAAIMLFWPDEKESIWSLIKDQVEELVETKILEHELNERSSQIDAIRASLLMYSNATNSERAGLMAAIVVQCNELYSELTQSDYVVHLIPAVISHAFVHLSVLRERYEHGLKLYPDSKDKMQWKRDLDDKYTDYKTFFLDMYPKWLEWREDEISVSTKTKKKPTPIPPFFYWTAYGSTKDAFTGDYVKYSDDWNSNKKMFKEVQNRAKERMLNEGEASFMMNAYSQTFSLHKFLPGHESQEPKAPPKTCKVSYGPYSLALKKGSHTKYNDSIRGDEVTDQCGLITEIHIWAGSFVDGIQFKYMRGTGHVFGKKLDRDPEVVILRSQELKKFVYVSEVEMGFANGVLAKIKFKLSDGTWTSYYGNKTWGLGLTQKVKANPDFQLVGAAGREGTSLGRAYGLSEFKMFFQYISTNP